MVALEKNELFFSILTKLFLNLIRNKRKLFNYFIYSFFFIISQKLWIKSKKYKILNRPTESDVILYPLISLFLLYPLFKFLFRVRVNLKFKISEVFLSKPFFCSRI